MIGLRVNRESRLAAAFLACGVVLIGVYFVLPAGGDGQAALYETLGLASVLATLWAVYRYRPRTPWPWILFALGNLAFVVGDIITDIEPNLASPSIADAAYLAGYPLIAAGLILLFIGAGGHHRFAAVAEAGIATFAFALIQWVFVMQPMLDGSGSVAERAVGATYPAGDVILLAGFAGFLVSPAWRYPSFWLLFGAVLSFLIGDEIYGFTTDTYTAGSLLDATWMLSYVLFGGAALHPSMRELAEPRRSAKLRVSTWRIGLLGAAVLAPAAVLLIQYARGAPLDVVGGRDRAGRDLVPRHVAADRNRARARAAAPARARRARRSGRGAGAARAAERAAARGGPVEGRVRRADLARPAHAADVDRRLHGAHARRGRRTAARRRAPLVSRGRRAKLRAAAPARRRPAVRRAAPGRQGAPARTDGARSLRDRETGGRTRRSRVRRRKASRSAASPTAR